MSSFPTIANIFFQLLLRLVCCDHLLQLLFPLTVGHLLPERNIVGRRGVGEFVVLDIGRFLHLLSSRLNIALPEFQIICEIGVSFLTVLHPGRGPGERKIGHNCFIRSGPEGPITVEVEAEDAVLDADDLHHQDDDPEHRRLGQLFLE